MIKWIHSIQYPTVSPSNLSGVKWSKFNSIFKISWVNKKSLKYLNKESMKGKPNWNICLASLLSLFLINLQICNLVFGLYLLLLYLYISSFILLSCSILFENIVLYFFIVDYLWIYDALVVLYFPFCVILDMFQYAIDTRWSSIRLFFKKHTLEQYQTLLKKNPRCSQYSVITHPAFYLTRCKKYQHYWFHTTSFRFHA